MSKQTADRSVGSQSVDHPWLDDLIAEMYAALEKYVDGHLRLDLCSNFGVDVVQETSLKLVIAVRSGKFEGIDGSNWYQPVHLITLKKWTFTVLKYTLLEKIRHSERFDHGAEGMELIAVTDEDSLEVSEKAQSVIDLVRQGSRREQEFWQRSGIKGQSDAELARLWGISERAVRTIRCRLLGWLRLRLS